MMLIFASFECPSMAYHVLTFAGLGFLESEAQEGRAVSSNCKHDSNLAQLCFFHR